MKKPVLSSLCKSVVLSICLTSTHAQSATVTLAGDNALTESWATGVDWSNGLPAAAGNDCTVGDSTGKTVRTPSSGTPSFPGNSLTMNPTGVLVLKAPTSTVNNLRLNGGRALNGNNVLQTLNGSIVVQAASTLESGLGASDARDLNIGSVISGNGALTVAGYNTGNIVSLLSTSNTYAGNWTLSGIFLDAVGNNSMGSGSITVNAGARFDADYPINSPGATLTLNGVMDLDQNHTFGTVMINGTALTPGTWSFATLNSAYNAFFTDGGSGSITVPPPPGVSYYMTLNGAGNQNGLSWGNAFPMSNCRNVLNVIMQSGDTVFLEGANYGIANLVLESNGTPSARKTIIGVDRGAGLPLFVGNSRSTSSEGNTSVYIRSGYGYWTVKNLRLQHRGWGLRAYGSNPGLIIDSCSAYDNVNGFAFADSDDLVVQNCDSQRYTKFGFQWICACDRVTVKDCYADATGTGDTIDYGWRQAFNGAGFKLDRGTNGEANNTDVLFEDCETRNNNQDTTTVGDYEQGDGWLVEFANVNITWRRCISYDNQQGGWDIKGLNQLLENCVALRCGNGIKVWKNATLNNCISSESSKAVVIIGDTVNPTLVLTANYCTFNIGDVGSPCLYIEKGYSGAVEADLRNCLLTFRNAKSTYDKWYIGGGFSGSPASVNMNAGTANESFYYDNTVNMANPPRFINPVLAWKPWIADPTGYDNQTYGLTKGYNPTR